jgi:phosphotransferase system enzyme I (PtsI)
MAAEVGLHQAQKALSSSYADIAARPATLRGLPVSAGLGIGETFLFPSLPFQLSGAPAGQTDSGREKTRLAAAIGAIAAEVAASDGPDAGGGMTAMLGAPLFHGSVIDRIDAGMTAADAVVQTTHDLISIYGDLADPVLRQRAEWAEAVGRRLFRRLHGLATPVFGPAPRLVLVTDEMSPFEATRLSPAHVAGIVAERGGATSHFAIIAKQLGIPVVAGDLASDPAFVPVLVGLGFNFLSATAPRLGAVRRAGCAIDRRQAQELARAVLTLADADQIRALLQGNMRPG